MKAKLLVCLLSFMSLLSTTTFGASFSRTPYQTGDRPVAVASADVNRDGFPDLFVANQEENTGALSTWLGSASGAFTRSGVVGTFPPVNIVTGDFTGDGYPDVVVLEEQGLTTFASAHNGILVSSGDFHPLPGGKEIVAVDLNGDRAPDVAVTRCGNVCELDTLLNVGGGNFRLAEQRLLTSSTVRGALAAGDFSRDSHDDLAVGDGTQVRIFRSNNNGRLTPTAILSVTGNIGVSGLAAGNLDTINGPDLVFQAGDACGPDCNFHSSAYVYLNNGSGTLVRKSQLDMGNMSGGINVLADVSGNNRLDLVHIVNDPNAGRLQYALYKGGGAFSALTLVTHFELPSAITLRDLNRDSRHDIALTDSFDDAIWVLRNTNAASICAPPSSANLAAKICAPSSSPGSRTFTVRGSGNSPTGVRRVELWIDGTKRYDSPDDQLSKSITLSAGAHRLVIQAVDQFGATARVTRSITVP